jgi:hypothetical protein
MVKCNQSASFIQAEFLKILSQLVERATAMFTIPEWSIQAIFAVAALFIGLGAKGMAKYVAFIAAMVIGGFALESALNDWRFWTLVGLIVAFLALRAWHKRAKAKREKQLELQQRNNPLPYRYPEGYDPHEWR